MSINYSYTFSKSFVCFSWIGDSMKGKSLCHGYNSDSCYFKKKSPMFLDLKTQKLCCVIHTAAKGFFHAPFHHIETSHSVLWRNVFVIIMYVFWCCTVIISQMSCSRIKANMYVCWFIYCNYGSKIEINKMICQFLYLSHLCKAKTSRPQLRWILV